MTRAEFIEKWGHHGGRVIFDAKEEIGKDLDELISPPKVESVEIASAIHDAVTIYKYVNAIRCCPVCNGTMSVPLGFYSHTISSGSTTGVPVLEPCRSCKNGLIFDEILLNFDKVKT